MMTSYSHAMISKIEDAETVKEIEQLLNSYIIRTGCATTGTINGVEDINLIALSLIRYGEYENVRLFAEASLHWASCYAYNEE